MRLTFSQNPYKRIREVGEEMRLLTKHLQCLDEKDGLIKAKLKQCDGVVSLPIPMMNRHANNHPNTVIDPLAPEDDILYSNDGNEHHQQLHAI